MENSISNSIKPQFRTTYQDLPPADKARVEQGAVENPNPYQYNQPPMPTRPSPKAPGSVASSIKSNATIKETPVRNDDIKPSLANRIGAKLLVAGACALSFLQKVVNAIVSAATTVVAKASTSGKAAKNYLTGLARFNKPASVDEKAEDVSEASNASDVDETK